MVLVKTDELMRSTYNLSGEALEENRAYAGDGVFRLSVGLEDPADILEELDVQLR